MSAERMIAAYQAIESDPKLTNIDKLVLLRWAWKTPEGNTPKTIAVKTYARELHCCPKAIRKSVARLMYFGYIKFLRIQAQDGAALKTVRSTRRASDTDTDRGGVAPPSKSKTVGGVAPPSGGCSAPPKGGVAPPHTNKLIKRDLFSEWRALPLRNKPPFEEYKREQMA